MTLYFISHKKASIINYKQFYWRYWKYKYKHCSTFERNRPWCNGIQSRSQTNSSAWRQSN